MAAAETILAYRTEYPLSGLDRFILYWPLGSSTNNSNTSSRINSVRTSSHPSIRLAGLKIVIEVKAKVRYLHPLNLEVIHSIAFSHYNDEEIA
jgi:hypothetical protein